MYEIKHIYENVQFLFYFDPVWTVSVLENVATMVVTVTSNINKV